MFRQTDLEAYLDEALPAEEMARIEKAARKDRRLVERLAAINARRNSGIHTLGEIWRRRRLGCPTREQLADYLRGGLEKSFTAHVEFHLDAVGCRYCRANLADLRARGVESKRASHRRRRKFFQSSAGYLKKK